MPPPSSVTSWVSRVFPKPTVDPEWLDACYDWITTSLHPPDTHPSLTQIHDAVSSQLLQSNLSDSMLPGTGLPQNVSTLDSTRLPTSPGILVEITAITDIGVSAFSLLNARNMRKETEELVGIYEDDGDELAREEIEQKGMKYPRSMLRFELSDGCITLQALEYRKLEQLELGETPLGYKMILKDVLIRGGIAFLEPNTVILKGHQTEDRQATQDRDFVQGLRSRMRQPPLPPLPPSPPAPRSPLRSISPPPSPPPPSRHDDDGPRRRRIPNPPPPTAVSGSGSATQASGTTTQVSQTPSSYFTESLPTSTSSTATSMEGLVRERLFSPVRRGPLPDAEKEDEGKGDASSSEFDFGDTDMGFDEQFLEEMQRVERDALGVGHNAGPSNNTSANAIHSAREAEDVILMDSDLEGDDKENIPLPKRNVRRRVEPSGERDVIEIMSDSE